MGKVDFETFMRESQKELGGTELIFTPEVIHGFKSASFNIPGSIVIGARSDLYDTLVVDRRNAPYLVPKSPEEWATSLIVKIPKGKWALIPVERAYVEEFIGHGLAEVIPGELMAILISSGPKIEQLDNAYKRKN